MGDGPLRRYDDPANGKLLAAIHAGHAPPDLLDAPIGQRVDVQVTSCIKNDYRPPFTETGIKLGGDPSKASARASGSAPSKGGRGRGIMQPRRFILERFCSNCVRILP
ncbi:hypothetical protein C8R46DRAFT_1062539 [Mycena filopes]|nr:hypothetical protein C8R46DRAFT_1062539 [Mycena filopes]